MLTVRRPKCEGADGAAIVPTDLFSGFSGLYYPDIEIADADHRSGSQRLRSVWWQPRLRVVEAGITLKPGNFLFEAPRCELPSDASLGDSNDDLFAGSFPENATAKAAFYQSQTYPPEQQTVVPEPASLVLTGSGLLALLRARRRARALK